MLRACIIVGVILWSATAFGQGFHGNAGRGRRGIEQLCEAAGIVCPRARAFEIDGRCVDPELGRAICVRDSDGGSYVFRPERDGTVTGRVVQEPKQRHMPKDGRTPRPRRSPKGGPH